jgi:hypothetical protein
MIKRSTFLLIVAILSGVFVGVSACNSNGAAPGSVQAGPDAGTATALVQNAQSTALVLKAQAMATALVGTLNAPLPGDSTQSSATPTVVAGTPGPTSSSPQTTPGGVEIVAVTTAADGAYIMVEFRAPARLVASWYQGKVSVVEESTGNVYAVIPSVGAIGPLISRPQLDGQLGYVMLVNAPVQLMPGAIVTVVLGEFKQKHLIIQ